MLFKNVFINPERLLINRIKPEEKMTKKMFTARLNLKTCAILIFLLTAALFFWESAFADLPQEIFFQAKLTTTGGTIVTGDHNVTFRLYNVSSGGSALWTETQSVTADSAGIVSCYLGATTAFPVSLDFNSTYYLSIEVDSGGEMSPRVKVVPAFSALNSDRFDGLNSAQFLRSDTADTMEAPFSLTSYFTLDYTGTAADAMNINFNPGSGAYDALDVTYGSAGGTGTALRVTQSGTGDILKLYSGSTGVLAVNDDGNVGIGTISPATLLDVNSKFNVLSGGNVGVGTASPVSLLDVNSKFNVLSGGNVGIGTTSPASLLDVNSKLNVLSAGNVGIGVVSPSARLDIKSAGASTGFAVRVQDSAGTNRIVILDNGNVGIGTTNPSAFKLEMAGNIGPAADSTYDLGTNTVRWANIYADNLYGNITPIGLTSGGIIFANGDGALTQDISNLYWDNTNNFVGIGTSSPTAGLTVGTGTNDLNTPTTSDVYIAGRLEVDGSTWLGDAAADTLTVVGTLTATNVDMTINNITINNNLNVNGNTTLGNASSDTLTVNAGALTLSNASTLDLAASSTALNIESGLLDIDTQNAKIGIGTTAPTAGLTVGTGTNDNAAQASSVYVTGNLEVDGSSWLGDAAADTLTVTGSLSATNTSMALQSLSVSGSAYLATSSGNVGIGTTNPGAALAVGSDAFKVTSAGTVTAGTWNGTAIGSQYGGTGINSLASSGIPKVSTGTWTINATQDDLGDGTTYKQYNPASVAITAGTINNTTIGASTATTGKFTTIEATSTGNAVTLSGAGANINFSGAGLAQITTASNQHLALMPAGSGNVGIGTSSPTAGLTVGTGTNDNASQTNSAYITGNLEVDGSTWLGDAAADTLTVTGTLNAPNVDMTIYDLTVNNNLSVKGGTTLGDNSADTITVNAGTLTLANAETIDLANSSTTALKIESGLLNLDTQNTRVGIGTTAPGAMLDVSGGSIRTDNQLISSVVGTAPLSVASNTLVNNLNADLLDGHDSAYFLASGSISGTTNYVAKFTDATSLGISGIFDNGNVGIGTTNPNLAKLTLQGAATIATTPSATDSDGTIYIGKSAESDSDHAPSNGSEYLMWDDNYSHGAKTGWFYFSGPVSMTSLNVRNPSSITFGTDTPQTVSYDATGGTSGTGAFTFSKEIITESSSPAYLTFAKSGGDTLYSLAFNPDITPKTLQLLSKSVGTGTTTPLFEFDTQGSFSVFDSSGNKKQIISSGTTFKTNPQNLIRSGSFETTKPTGWATENGATFGTNIDIGNSSPSIPVRFGTKYLKIKDTSSSASHGASFFIPDAARFRGESLTLSFYARAASGTQNAAVGYKFDNNPTVLYKIANVGITWTNYKLTFPDAVPSDCSSIKLYAFGNNGTTGNALDGTQTNSDWVFFDGLSLVTGNLAVDFGPSPITDTGDQVMFGNLAIGAGFDPYQSGNYYAAPRITFGEPDSYYGTGYGGYGMGAGEIRFLQWGGYDAGRFEFNRPIRIFDAMTSTYGASFMVNTEAGAGPTTANQKGDAYVSGRTVG